MKRIVKKALKAIWWWTRPLRRPLQRKFEECLSRCLASSLREMSDETNALMNQVVRDLVRLQRQVDLLQQTMEAWSDAREDRAVAGGIDYRVERATAEQLKAG